MKTRLSLCAGVAGLTATFAFLLASPAFAHEGHKKEEAATQVSADGKAAYPLSTCVVSGDKLESGDMGPPIDYVHKEEGKPDRLVRLCCKGCVKDFKKDPAKYLKAIDDAAAAKAKGEKPADHGDGHTGHSH